MSSNISRRALAKGAAWAAPAVLATAAVPAYAASMCGVPRLRYGGGIDYKFGTIGSTSTTQTLTLGSRVYVDNLPQGVTVSDFKITYWVQNRIGQQSPGPGIFWIGNVSSSYYGQNMSALRWTPTAGSGFSPTATNTQNLVNHTYSNGTSGQSWDLNLTWSAAQNRQNSYTASATNPSCRTFDSGESGSFVIQYNGVVGPTSLGNQNQYVRADVHIQATLSNGQVLTYTSSTAQFYPR